MGGGGPAGAGGGGAVKGHVARLILVSREFRDGERLPVPADLPRPDLFQWFVTWDYPATDADTKFGRLQQSFTTLEDIIAEGEGRHEVGR